ncbi:MAG: hypothetical protein RIE31_08805 [Alphaproteobacteria bacterium]
MNDSLNPVPRRRHARDSSGAKPVSESAAPVPAAVSIRLAAVALAIGLSLLALALPELGRGVAIAGTERVRPPVALTTDRQAAPFLAAAVQRQRGLAWRENSEDWSLIAAVQFARAAGDGFRGSAASQALAAARAADEAALRCSIADSYGWMRLLTAAALSTPARPAADAEPAMTAFERLLVMSITTAPADPDLVMARLDMALGRWAHLSEDTTRLLQRQVHLAARWDMGRLVEATRRSGRLVEVRAALTGQPRLAARFAIHYRPGHGAPGA